MTENNNPEIKEDKKSFVEMCKESLDHIVQLSKVEKVDKRNDVRSYMRKIDNVIGQLKVR